MACAPCANGVVCIGSHVAVHKWTLVVQTLVVDDGGLAIAGLVDAVEIPEDDDGTRPIGSISMTTPAMVSVVLLFIQLII